MKEIRELPPPDTCNLLLATMLTLSSTSLERYGLNRVFEFAKKAQYDGVDIEVTRIFDTFDAQYIKSLTEQSGIPLVNFVLPKKLTSKDQVMKYIDIAAEAGAQIVTMHPPKLFDFSFAQWMKTELPQMRKKFGIKIALLNATPARLLGFLPQHAMNSASELKKFRQVCLDTSNTYALNEDLIRMYEKLKGEIVHIFLSNVRNGRDHTLPMEGSLPIESLLTKLKRDEYKGAISIRVMSRELGEGNEEHILQKLQLTKEFVQKYMA